MTQTSNQIDRKQDRQANYNEKQRNMCAEMARLRKDLGLSSSTSRLKSVDRAQAIAELVARIGGERWGRIDRNRQYLAIGRRMRSNQRRAIRRAMSQP